jgi:hypothetical protein
MRPAVPVWRDIPGPVGQFLRSLHRFVRELVDNRPHVWGNEVTVTFAAADTDTRVDHGLGYPATGFFIVHSSGDIRVWHSPSTPSSNESITLRASATGTCTVYVY